MLAESSNLPTRTRTTGKFYTHSASHCCGWGMCLGAQQGRARPSKCGLPPHRDNFFFLWFIGHTPRPTLYKKGCQSGSNPSQKNFCFCVLLAPLTVNKREGGDRAVHHSIARPVIVQPATLASTESVEPRPRLLQAARTYSTPRTYKTSMHSLKTAHFGPGGCTKSSGKLDSAWPGSPQAGP